MINSKFIIIPSLIFIIAAGFIACSNNKVLSRDKMVAVLHDIQLSEALYQVKSKEFSSNDQKEALVAGVLKKHGITQAQLDSSLVWYSDNMEIYLKVNDSVTSTLKRESNRLGKIMPPGTVGTRVNNSVLPRYFYLTDATPLLTFNIDSAQMNKYPVFNLEFKTLGFHNKIESEAVVYFTYADTIINRQYNLSRNSSHKITKPQVSDTLRSISGFFHINPTFENRKALLYDIYLNDSTQTKNKSVIPRSGNKQDADK